MRELSRVPAGVAAQAHVYLAQGGPENLAQLHAFLSDTVLLTGEGFDPPAAPPTWAELPRAAHSAGPEAVRGAPPPPRQLRRCPATGRHPLLPGAADGREHRVRARPRRRRG